jgi:hypothetical protein
MGCREFRQSTLRPGVGLGLTDPVAKPQVSPRRSIFEVSTMNRQLLIAFALIVLAAAGQAAQAQTPCNYGWYGWGGHGHYGYELPYYTLHPPVYYSYPVPRSYGYSPYAYPPGTLTPEVQVEFVDPKVMINPFVPGNEAAPAPEQTTGGPRMIYNPYVDTPSSRPVEVALQR